MNWTITRRHEDRSRDCQNECVKGKAHELLWVADRYRYGDGDGVRGVVRANCSARWSIRQSLRTERGVTTHVHLVYSARQNGHLNVDWRQMHAASCGLCARLSLLCRRVCCLLCRRVCWWLVCLLLWWPVFVWYAGEGDSIAWWARSLCCQRRLVCCYFGLSFVDCYVRQLLHWFHRLLCCFQWEHVLGLNCQTSIKKIQNIF